MPTSTALRAAPSVESAPALSTMMAAAFFEIAVSMSSDCLLTSSSWEKALAVYPSSCAAATAASASVLKKGLSWEGVMTAM